MPLSPMRTARLRLREWQDADRAPFAAMHADPSVMQFMPRVLRADECEPLVGHNLQHFREHGFGLWSIEVVGVCPYVGYAGLLRTSFAAPFTPCVEIAWMLARGAWSHGYAVEAAAAIAERAFGELGLAEIVSFTVPSNARSRRVMERLGMIRDEAGSFQHPRLPEGHRLREHVLYRLSKARWGDRRVVERGQQSP